MDILKSLLAFIFLPVYLALRTVKKRQHPLLKAFSLAIIIFLLSPLWAFGGLKLAEREKIGLNNIGQKIGVVNQIEYISGTGSMFPTFPKGEGKTNLERMAETVASHAARSYPGGIFVNGKRYYGYELQRGDIVFFDNDKTKEIIAKESSGSAEQNIGFVKRLIALPGDTVEIRNGFIIINGLIINEPYIAKARSTYGGGFLPDCKTITVPEGFVFVLGDNRKASNDSRFDLGLVAKYDIKTVIPIDKQDDLKSHYRDTTNDTKEANKPIFDSQKYLELLNQKRREAQLSPLVWKDLLEKSAQKRSAVMLKFNDTSFEATRSGYTMKQSLNDVGYYNIVYGEIPAVGYYEAEELLDNFFQFPDSKQFLLKPEFSDTGVSASVGEINGCPTQIVVQHLAGYVPPNYDQKTIDNWGGLLKNLNEIIPSWEKAREYQNVNQDDLRKMLDLMYLRRTRTQKIYDRMKANQWLTNEETNYANDDNNLYLKIKELADKINKK